jgi:hypothetical protein
MEPPSSRSARGTRIALKANRDWKKSSAHCIFYSFKTSIRGISNEPGKKLLFREHRRSRSFEIRSLPI